MEIQTTSPLAKQSCFNRDLQAYAVLLLSGWFFVGGYSLGAQSSKLNAATVNLWRGLSTALFSAIIVRVQGRSLEFKCSDDLKILNWRGIFFVLHGFMLAASLTYLPPPVVHTINASGPVLVFVIDYFRNGITVSCRQMLGIFVACIGLVLTINAAMIMQWMGYAHEEHSKFDYIESSAQVKTIVSSLLLVCQVLWAFGMVITKEVKTQTASQIGFHLGLGLALSGALAGMWLGFPDLDFQEEMLIIAKVSAPLGIASVMMTFALTMTKKTGNLTMVTFNNVLTGYLISIYRYGEKLNWLAIIGSCSIFFGLFFVLIR